MGAGIFGGAAHRVVVVGQIGFVGGRIELFLPRMHLFEVAQIVGIGHRFAERGVGELTGHEKPPPFGFGVVAYSCGHEIQIVV